MSDSAEGESRSLAVEGTAVALESDASRWGAVLLLGKSGSGKSDLALRLIDGGARLIADDRVELVAQDARLYCRAPLTMPSNLRGRIEARGIGILPVPSVDPGGDPGVEIPVPLLWCVELVPGPVERLPAAESRRFLGIAAPLIRLDPFEASAVAKLRLAAACGPGLIMGRE